MNDRLHIIIAGDEGKTRNFLFSKRRLQLSLFITVSIFISLSVVSYKAYHFFYANKQLTSQINTLNTAFEKQLTALNAELVSQTTTLNTALNSQTATFNKQLQENISARKMLTLQVQNLQKQNSSQTANFQQEKTALINNAVIELEERSGMIKQIMDNLGISINDTKRDHRNSGGPFIAPIDTIGKDLLFRSDRYMEAITLVPLGRPVPGKITSRFGHRSDPVNGKKGFHSGVDIRGQYGQKVLATADGTVTKSYVNGSYGQYIEISHGNGYITKFAHMRKRLVKRGAKVKRGQVIGTVGSSGRSTGPHLHYEVCLNAKPLNPNKFMHVDTLVLPPVIPRLTVQNKQKIKHKLASR